MNKERNCEPCGSNLTQANLGTFRRHLARIRPTLSRVGQGAASNMIEQIKELQRGNEMVRPYLAASMRRLEREAAVYADET